jgi:hypothetical protein
LEKSIAIPFLGATYELLAVCGDLVTRRYSQAGELWSCDLRWIAELSLSPSG